MISRKNIKVWLLDRIKVSRLSQIIEEVRSIPLILFFGGIRKKCVFGIHIFFNPLFFNFLLLFLLIPLRSLKQCLFIRGYMKHFQTTFLIFVISSRVENVTLSFQLGQVIPSRAFLVSLACFSFLYCTQQLNLLLKMIKIELNYLYCIMHYLSNQTSLNCPVFFSFSFSSR